jgi:hypothetical protein
MKDDDDKTALNISISTAGFKTIEIWLKKGYEFDLPLNQNKKDNVFIACQFGHIDMLELLNKRIGMDLFRVKLDGESTVEYCLRRGNFDCYIFVLNYFIANNKLIFTSNNNDVE